MQRSFLRYGLDKLRMRLARAFPYIIGFCIVALISIVMFQFQEYQNEINQREKQAKIDQINKMISQRQKDIELLTSTIAGFYKGSEEVTSQEFEVFARNIVSSRPQVANIFVLEDHYSSQFSQKQLKTKHDIGSYTVVQSYPHSEFIGSKFGKLFREYPAKIDNTPLAFVQSQQANTGTGRNIVVAVPFDFFIQPELLLGDSYKIAFVEKESPDPAKSNVLYSIEKTPESSKAKQTKDFDLTQEQQDDAVTISKDISLFGSMLGDTYTLNYIVWSKSLEPAIESRTVGPVYQWILFGIGISLAVIIPLLMLRSEHLKSEAQKISQQLQESNMKLREIDKAKNEFSTMITHELKTPLVTILGYAEILKDPQVGKLSEYQTEAVNEIMDSSKQLTNLIDDILVAQKLDMGKLKINKSKFNAADIVNQVRKDFEPVCKNKNVTLKSYPDPSAQLEDDVKERTDTGEVLTIYSDKERISQVLANLVKNSIDFVPYGNGIIEIGVKPYGGADKATGSYTKTTQTVLFYVKDNGTGIPKGKEQDVFKKFYQLDSSSTRKHGGTGLGLVICKGIVELLGGDIWFESKEGKGTVFYFTIPNNGEQ